MRKSAIIVISVLIVLTAVTFYFTRDSYAERGIERIGEIIAEAKVEIDNFHYSVFGLECSWDRLQVADKNDPWRNILDIGRASFAIETRPLFWKRFVIKEMVLENVRNGTKRETDGSLPKPEEEPSEKEQSDFFAEAKASLDNQLRDLPVFDLSSLTKSINIDSLVNLDNLVSIQRYERLKKDSDSLYGYWQDAFKKQDYTKQIDGIKKDLKKLPVDELQKEIKSLQKVKIKNVNDIVKLNDKIKTIEKKIKDANTKIKKIQSNANSLKSDVQNQYNTLTGSIGNLERELKGIKSALKEDIKRAQQMARLQLPNVKDISLLLFGEPMVQKFDQIMGYVNMGRKYLPTAKKLVKSNKEESPPRFKGQNIRFPFHYSYPEFLIRNVKFSGATASGDTSRGYFLDGGLKGVTNEPSVYGYPTSFNVDFMKISGNHYNISGSLDHRTEVSRDTIRIAAENFKLGEIKLSQKPSFPRVINLEKGNIKLTGIFVDNSIDIKVDFDSPISFGFEGAAKGKMSEIVRDVLSEIKRLQLTVRLKGSQSDYKMQMNSNIDKELSRQLKRVLQKNLEEARLKVEKRVRDEVEKYRREAEGIINKNRQKLLTEINKSRQKAQKQLDEVNNKKKDLENRVNKEKDKLEKQVDDEQKKLESEVTKKLEKEKKKLKEEAKKRLKDIF